MNRAEFIKRVSVFGAASILPIKQLIGKTDTKKFHLIGLGDAGAGIIKYCYEKDRDLQYTVINSEFKEKPNSSFDIVEFNRPSNAYLENNPSLKKVNINAVRINNSLPQNIEPIFSDKSKNYVLFSSLGGFTGSYLSLAIAKKLQQENIKYYNIVNIPPFIISPFRRDVAISLKQEFNNIPNTYFFDSENLRRLYGNYKMNDQNKLANQELYKIFHTKFCI